MLAAFARQHHYDDYVVCTHYALLAGCGYSADDLGIQDSCRQCSVMVVKLSQADGSSLLDICLVFDKSGRFVYCVPFPFEASS